MSAPQRGLQERFQEQPQPGVGYMPIMSGYVLATDRTARTVDVLLRGGGRLFAVPVVASLAGDPFIPTVSSTTNAPTGKDVEAVIAYIGGDYRRPVCLGLIFPAGYTESGHKHDYSWTGSPGSGQTGIPRDLG